MWEGVGDVEEEVFVFVPFNEVDGSLGDTLGEVVGIRFHLDDFFAFE